MPKITLLTRATQERLLHSVVRFQGTMKSILFIFVFGSLMALRCNGFQVTSPTKLVFGPDSFVLTEPSGGSHNDFIISMCRATPLTRSQKSTPLYKKNADGTYDMLLLPELQVCSLTQYWVETNGKWIFVSAYNETAYYNKFSYSAFYTFNGTNESDPLTLHTRYDDVFGALNYVTYAKFVGEDRLMAVIYDYTDNYLKMVEWFMDGTSWNRTFLQNLVAIDFNNATAQFALPSFDPKSSVFSQYIGDDHAVMFSKQETGDWELNAFLGQKNVESYETIMQESSVNFNGNNTIIYLGCTRTYWSSGTVYISEYQSSSKDWKVVKKFNSEDVGLDNEYLNLFYTWAQSVVWINQDMAFLMAQRYPTNYNETDWLYGGSVVMIYKDNTGQWQAGGRISNLGDDGSGEAVQFQYLTRTASDIVITGVVASNLQNPVKYVMYSYPLCFPKKLSFTCNQNIAHLASCDEASFVVPREAYNYVDDECGEPMASINRFVVSNGTVTVDLKFERLGLEVGQCTGATFTCPLPPVEPIAEPMSTPKSGQISEAQAIMSTETAVIVLIALCSLSTLY